MAKKQVKTFTASQEQFDYMRVCNNNDLAFYVKPVYNLSPNYYICRYKISKYKDISYLREDVTLPDKESNRLKFNEYDAWKKIFELYKEHSNKFKIKKL